jgi:predicted transposase YbfD/YdcC
MNKIKQNIIINEALGFATSISTISRHQKVVSTTVKDQNSSREHKFELRYKNL